MRTSELRYLLTSREPAAVTWRATAPASEWARALVQYRQEAGDMAGEPVVRLFAPEPPEEDAVTLPDWLPVAEAARVSHYHAESIRRLIRDGKLHAEKRGRAWHVSGKSLAAHMARRKGGDV